MNDEELVQLFVAEAMKASEVYVNEILRHNSMLELIPDNLVDEVKSRWRKRLAAVWIEGATFGFKQGVAIGGRQVIGITREQIQKLLADSM